MKKIVTFVVISAVIAGVVLYIVNRKETFTFDRTKMGSISYNTDITYDKISKQALVGEYDISRILTEKDRDNIYHCLNDGKLIPDKRIHTHKIISSIRIWASGITIDMQSDGSFAVCYNIVPYSNSNKDDRITTIHSKVLRNYFIKLKKQIKNLEPSSTWTTKVY
jgi:hypothetical protein